MELVPTGDPTFLRGLVTQVDPAAVLVAVRDETGVIVDLLYVEANDLACEFLETPREVLVGGTLLTLFPRHRESGLFRAFADALETGDTLVMDGYELDSAVRPVGTRFDMRAARFSDLLVVSWRDDTERSAAAAAVAASEARFRLLAENASDVVVLADADGRVTWVSPLEGSSFGLQAETLLGRTILEFLHPDDIVANGAAIERFRSGERVTVRVRLRSESGDYRWISSRVTPIRDADGQIVARVAGWRDIHDEQLAIFATEALSAQLKVLVENSSDAVAACDETGTLTWISESVTRLTGWAPEQLVGERFDTLVHPEDREMIEVSRVRLMAGNEITYETRIRTATGTHTWISVRARPQRNDEGKISGHVAGWRDIQREHDNREALERSDERFRAAMRSAPIGTVVVDLDRRIRSVNPAGCVLLGRTEAELAARHISEMFDPADHETDLRMRTHLLTSDEPSVSTEQRLVTRDGTTVWVQHVLALVRNEKGEPAGFVSQFLDITTNVRLREQLRYHATHDPLTHVGNREELRDRIAALLSHPMPADSSGGVLFVDVDQLKEINDRHGHDVGDQVLIDVAATIVGCTRGDDVVVRYGGDEFVVVISDARSITNLTAIAEKIRTTVHARHSTDTQLNVTVSIGAALQHPHEDPHLTLRRADGAMYLAKRNGRNRVEITDSSTDAIASE